MSVNIQLEKETYNPWEKIKGVLSVHVSKPTRARKIQIAFEGKEHTIIVRGSGDDETTYKENNMIVEQKIDVWDSVNGEYLGPCSELFPFEFQLPNNALPTVTSQNNSRSGITYEIKAKIDRPLALDPKVSRVIQVIHQPIDMYPTKTVTETFVNPSGTMHLEVIIDKNVFKPGDRVTGTAKFKQSPNAKVRARALALKFIESFTAEGKTDTFPTISDQVRFEVNPLGDYKDGPYSLITNSRGPYSIFGKLVRHKWVLDVKVDLPFKRD